MGKKKEGPKRLGVTKPPRSKTHKSAPPALPRAKLVGKKKHRQAARAAAHALIAHDVKRAPVQKSKFAY